MAPNTYCFYGYMFPFPILHSPPTPTPMFSVPIPSPPYLLPCSHSSIPMFSIPMFSISIPPTPMSSFPIPPTPMSSFPIPPTPMSSFPIPPTPMSSFPIPPTPMSSSPSHPPLVTFLPDVCCLTRGRCQFAASKWLVVSKDQDNVEDDRNEEVGDD
ncbi:hypothetical protein EDB89DRAFT_2083154 [Lactarius sanguifluus]|nr:hypothetical protein EDB89DRAFT_2083154 [Lactarius sanguifluus]